MDNSFHPQTQRSDIRRSGTFFTALLKIFDNAFHWLVGFFQLTEDEQREAGIYLDRPYEE
ncbi:MAG TPA: hypothetical protein VIS72_07645 [Anaerolineales bacterium]